MNEKINGVRPLRYYHTSFAGYGVASQPINNRQIIRFRRVHLGGAHN